MSLFLAHSVQILSPSLFSLSLTLAHHAFFSLLSPPSAEALKRKEKMQALISRVTSAQSKSAVSAAESEEPADDAVAAQLDTLSLDQVAAEEDQDAATNGGAAATGDAETGEQATEPEEGEAEHDNESEPAHEHEDEGTGEAEGEDNETA